MTKEITAAIVKTASGKDTAWVKPGDLVHWTEDNGTHAAAVVRMWQNWGGAVLELSIVRNGWPFRIKAEDCYV